MKLTYTARLENVRKIRTIDGYVYTGRVYNDQKGRWLSGTTIKTSLVMSEKEILGGRIITTRNSVYYIPYSQLNQH
jgi:hypothetical protein